ncbi:sulfurtransferase [Sorangium sp. So ce131]|uniref:sulfurtransferase n=1 Tax=Sorangium sp. So ce131 TaxID=3133282 RepID=UPI003F5DD761
MQHQVLIEPRELASLLTRKPIVTIDTRSSDEYLRSHLPGAVHVPEIFGHFALSSPAGQEELKAVFSERFSAAGLTGEELAVVYEDAMDNGFGRSCRGYVLLSYLGYPRIAVLHGGKAAWDAAGLPTTADTPSQKRALFPFRINPSILATADDLLASLSDPGVVKLDVRQYDEWMGETASPQDVVPCPRKGRIPGAVWLDWRRLMTRAGGIARIRRREEVLTICSEVGVHPGSKIILYCLGGVRASNTYVALKEAGFEDVKVYLGSWYEWSRDPALPIEEGEPDPRRMAIRA